MLEFHNTPDLFTAAKTLGCCDLNQTRQHQKVKVKELKTWLKPRLEPHDWKYNLAKMAEKIGATKLAEKLEYEYNAEEDNNRKSVSSILKFATNLQASAFGDEFDKDEISRDEFIRGVTANIREGKTEVASVQTYGAIFFVKICREYKFQTFLGDCAS